MMSISHPILFLPESRRLRVLNLNTWGLGWPFSSDRAIRFQALRDVLAKSPYDVVLLQEVGKIPIIYSLRVYDMNQNVT